MRLLAIPLLLLSLWGGAAQASLPDTAISFVPTTEVPAPDPGLTPERPPTSKSDITPTQTPPTDSLLSESVVEPPAPTTAPQSPALSFVPPTLAPAEAAVETAPRPVLTQAAPTVAHTSTGQRSAIFAGGSDSLVARTVGHAEGTRTADGHKTRAYYGHSDPGNGVWNLGSFSYQHAARSPEDADEKQLRRLQGQADMIRQKADAHRLSLSLEEELNAIDLANQSPLAALDTPGYVEWLKQARERGLKGSDAVLWARTQSYWNPQRQRWEAPGLGNTEAGIRHDQNRRLTAIARALDTYQQQTTARKAVPTAPVVQPTNPEQVADQIIFQDLAPNREVISQVP